MPFTLAHPAAALPLRRYCPRLLDFPALIIGTLTPDAGYVLSRVKLHDFSHSPIGSIAFCLPAGVLAVTLFYLLRTPVVERLPERQRTLFEPLCRRPRAAWFAVVVSVLIGVWTHLLWDSFTHKNGWLVGRIAVLESPLFVLGGRTFRMAHVFWYVCSFGGVAWLYLVFERWRRASSATKPLPIAAALLHAAIAGALSVVIAIVHHLVHGWMSIAAVGVLSLLLLAAIVFRREKMPVQAEVGEKVPGSTR